MIAAEPPMFPSAVCNTGKVMERPVRASAIAMWGPGSIALRRCGIRL